MALVSVMLNVCVVSTYLNPVEHPLGDVLVPEIKKMCKEKKIKLDIGIISMFSHFL